MKKFLKVISAIVGEQESRLTQIARGIFRKGAVHLCALP